mgnify:CR=1 FL=1
MDNIPQRILIVEDDEKLRSLLERHIREHGFDALGAEDGVQMAKVLVRTHIDLIVLDIMLPGEDGLTLCRDLRGQKNDVPILILTAKGDDLDRIIGLEIGADDYLAKPCNPRELVARIKAILRRTGSRISGAPIAEESQVYYFGPFSLNLSTRQLFKKDDNLYISTSEFALLAVMVKYPKVTLNRDQLISLTKGRDHAAFERSVDIQISRLRKIIENDPSKPRYIQTVWGTGYTFIPDEGGDGEA